MKPAKCEPCTTGASILNGGRPRQTMGEWTLLGIDIHQFARNRPEAIELLPPLVVQLFDCTERLCHLLEPTLFRDPPMRRLRRIQNTGDGGHVAFETPLQALVYNVYFQLCARLVNVGILFPEVRGTLDGWSGREFRTSEPPPPNPLDLLRFRSVMVQSSAFLYRHADGMQEGYMGQAGIDVARLLSTDKLDRFLMNEKVHTWFLQEMMGLELLPEHTADTLLRVAAPGKRGEDQGASLPFRELSLRSYLLQPPPLGTGIVANNAFVECTSQKLGKVPTKESRPDLYNVEIRVRVSLQEILFALSTCYGSQARLVVARRSGNRLPDTFYLAIGNLSSHRIADESPA